ncbi:MAG: DUF1501 domain-containing protein [Alphaproteobacteria bacterium]
MLTRRDALSLFGAGFVTAWVGPGARIAFAAAPTDHRLVVVILRGALDGLAAIPPLGDRDYQGMRGGLAFASAGNSDGALDLDGFFALNPALQPLQDMFKARELLVFHAVATPYRARSHFDGQDLLENGTTSPRGPDSGWLNRALGLIGSDSERIGLAVGQGVPLILRGKTPVGAWAPRQMPELDAGFLDRLAALYKGDKLFAAALSEGMAAQDRNDEVLAGSDKKGPGMGMQYGAGALKGVVADVGKLLADPNGPRIAAMDAGGWDTHAGQGVLTGRLAGALKGLGESLAALKESMGLAWNKTVVAVITEFGRTVAENGTGGTDHGTAGAAFLLGGAVQGGKVVTRWPGLSASALYEGRDLAPTLDLRSVLKGVLAEHLNLSPREIDSTVFPDSASAAPLRDLARV